MKKYINKLIWHIRGGYKPEKFWDNWSHTFQDDQWQVNTHTQHNWLLTKIKLIRPKSIAELGVGFGRNIKYLMDKNVKVKMTGTDISEKMLQKAKQFLKGYDVKLQKNEIDKIPLKTNSHDLVFTHGVLMHIDKIHISKTISELIRISKKDIIMIEQNYGSNEYTFIHDYKKLLSKSNVTIIEYKKSTSLGLDLIHAQISK